MSLRDNSENKQSSRGEEDEGMDVSGGPLAKEKYLLRDDGRRETGGITSRTSRISVARRFGVYTVDAGGKVPASTLFSLQQKLCFQTWTN